MTSDRKFFQIVENKYLRLLEERAVKIASAKRAKENLRCKIQIKSLIHLISKVDCKEKEALRFPN